MHKEWSNYRSKLVKRWERGNKLYNNERYKKNYEGNITDTFVPMAHSTIETMVAALATGDLSTTYIPQDVYKYFKDRFEPLYNPESGYTEEEHLIESIRSAVQGGIIEDEPLEVLNAWYDYCWQSGDWDEKLEQLIRSGLKIGNGAWWVTWKGKPCLETVPFPDFIFDPAAKDDESCRYMGRRYLANLEDLRKEEIIDPLTGKAKKRFTLTGVGKRSENGTEDKHDKELKEEMLLGSTLDSGEEGEKASKMPPKQVEVIEIMTKDRYYTVINRKVLAEDTVNPYKAQAELKGMNYSGIVPGISWANYKDESLLVGKSEIETFWQEQERLNDSTNQKGDAVIRSMLQNYRADPALKSQANSFGVPGAVVWAQTNQFEPIPTPPVPNAAFNEEISIKNNIRETTATDQIVKGVGTTSDVTATEAKLQVANAGQRIELKIKSLERGPLKRLARLVLQMTQLFIEDPFIVPAGASNGIKPLVYRPEHYAQDFEPKISLSIDGKNKQRMERESALEAYKILISDPTNNLSEIKMLLLPKIVDLDKDDIKRIVENPQQAMPGMEVAPQGGMPPAAPMGVMQ